MKCNDQKCIKKGQIMAVLVLPLLSAQFMRSNATTRSPKYYYCYLPTGNRIGKQQIQQYVHKSVDLREWVLRSRQ